MEKSLQQALKARAHHLKPVVIIGSKGLTTAVIEETNMALLAHELIKVKIHGLEKDERKILIESLCDALSASSVQYIGNIAVIYRKNEEG